ERWMRALHRLRFAAGVAELVVGAVECCGLSREQVDDDFAAFLEPVAAFSRRSEVNAVRAGLLLVPSRTEPDLEPPAGDDVEGRGHVRENRRVAVVDGGDQYAEAQPFRCLSERGKRRPPLEAGAGGV